MPQQYQLPKFPRNKSSPPGVSPVPSLVTEDHVSLGKLHRKSERQHVSQSLHCPYHPQSSVAIERYNSIFKTELANRPELGLPWLPIALMTLRCSPLSPGKRPSFEIILGRPMRTPSSASLVEDSSKLPGSRYMVNTPHKGMIHVLGKTEQDSTRFLHATQNEDNVKHMNCLFLEFSL